MLDQQMSRIFDGLLISGHVFQGLMLKARATDFLSGDAFQSSMLKPVRAVINCKYVIYYPHIVR